tara:strand:+ start:5596 stop:6090 length:495 start_codon:yes stop_codon:yes gene_type:complete
MQAIDLDSLDSGSATRQYPLGTVIGVNDTSKGSESQFVYCKAHAALGIGVPFQVVSSSGGNAEAVTLVPIAQASGAMIGFATTAITSGHFCWLQIGGIINAATGTVAVGDHVQLLVAGVSLVVDGSTGSTVETADSIGTARTVDSGGFASISVVPTRRVAIAAA